MKRDKLTLWLPTAATLILALGLWMGYTITTNRLKLTAPRTTESSAAGSKLDYTLSLINRAYVDKIDTDTIVENLMHDMMAQLDPHSVYVPAEELKGRTAVDIGEQVHKMMAEDLGPDKVLKTEE